MLTVTFPVDVFRFFSFSTSTNEKHHFPNFLSFSDHVRAIASCLCAVKTSSQSFHLVEEYEILVIGGSLRDAMEVENDVAFLAIGPVDELIENEKLVRSARSKLHREWKRTL